MLDPEELRRHRRALRILVVVLTPLAIWTAVGLIALWPGDISDHVNTEVSGYAVEGVTYPEAQISAISPLSCEGLSGSTPGVADNRCLEVTARLLEGDDIGKEVAVPLGAPVAASGVELGQKIILIRVPPAGGQPAQYQFSDFSRGLPLLLMAALFAVIVVVVARWRGLASLVGLGFAAFIMVKFLFPALIAGSNPIMVGLIGSSAIMFVVLYATHGFSARTSTALVGTLFGLILIAALSYVATKWAHLTGVGAEDDYVLAAAAPDLQLTSVVVCAVIIAGLGVLNDVTITQASAVWELADASESRRHLFSRAMRIGRDHIASTVYTIAFATAGATLGVLLLIAIYNRPLLEVIETEQFAEEIVRTLVGSIGLVLAMPLTTAVGVAVVRASTPRKRRRSGSTAAAAQATEPKAGTATAASEEALHDPDAAEGGDGSASDETTVVGADSGGVDADQARTDGAPAGADEASDEPQPADSDSADPAATAVLPRVRRARRTRPKDDFGDFTYLRDPDASDPGDPPRR